MAMENDCEPVQRLLVSVAVTVKVKLPVAVGGPLMAPADESTRPVGIEPDVTANVYVLAGGAGGPFPGGEGGREAAGGAAPPRCGAGVVGAGVCAGEDG